MTTLTRAQAREILQKRKHCGEIAAIARRLNKTRQSVHDVVNGKKVSAEILAALISRAQELAAQEAEPTKEGETACA